MFYLFTYIYSNRKNRIKTPDHFHERITMLPEWFCATFTVATVLTSTLLSLNETLRLLYPVWYDSVTLSVVYRVVRWYSLGFLFVRKVANYPALEPVWTFLAELMRKDTQPDLVWVRGGQVVHYGHRRDLYIDEDEDETTGESEEEASADSEDEDEDEFDFLLWSYDDGLGDPVPRFHVIVPDEDTLLHISWNRPAISVQHSMLCEVTFLPKDKRDDELDILQDTDKDMCTFHLHSQEDSYFVVGNVLSPAFFTYLFHTQCGVPLDFIASHRYHIQLMDNYVQMYELDETQSLVVEADGWKVITQAKHEGEAPAETEEDSAPAEAEEDMTSMLLVYKCMEEFALYWLHK